MLVNLLRKYGMPSRYVAEEANVSDTAVRNWIAGDIPSSGNAVAVARLFSEKDGAELLRHWGYSDVAESWREVLANQTHDPNVANGWRLDTLIAETRELRKELRQQHTEAMNATTERIHVTAHFSIHDLRMLAEFIRGDDDDDPPEEDKEPAE